MRHNGKPKKGFVQDLIGQSQHVHEWLTRDMVYNALRPMERLKPTPSTTQRLKPSPSTAQVAQVGRPKGSTNAAKATMKARKEKAIENVTIALYNAKTEAKVSATKLPYGTLKRIIHAELCSSQLANDAPDFEIPQRTIYSRVNRMSDFTKSTPPIGRSVCLSIINSLIKGTPHQQQLIDWKRRRGMEGDDAELGKVGNTYWSSFKKRNKTIIDGGSVSPQDVRRAEWCTHENFKAMYEMVYEVFHDAGITEELPEPVWMDLHGNIVDSEEKAFGEKVTHLLKHPDHLIMVDEVGSNTNQKHDGNVGGEKLLKPKGGKAQKVTATTDSHFTVLGFTAATGEPVMCAIILAGKSITNDQILGMDIQAASHGDVTNIAKNKGKGKRHPGGPD